MGSSCTMAADPVRSLVLVENETYELIDGDGNFYVSKTNLGPISTPFQATDPFANFPNADFDEMSSSVIPPQSNMEPILINDYGKMNFFTQANANVTIYLNTDNGDSFINENNQCSNEVIDLTTNSVIDTNEKESSPKVEHDLPEFIDLSQLKLPYQEIFHKEENEPSKEITHDREMEGDDNDVVFVKEYTIENGSDHEDSLPLDLRRNQEKKLPQEFLPRRNPKRTVQIFKEYYSKFKYSPDFYGSTRKKKDSLDNKKKPGAVLNPPPLLTNEHFKEWPTEGMHEKPVYNTASKKLEPIKKTPNKTTKEVVKKRTFKKGKRKINKTKAKEETNEEISKEFATLTHETFQDVIGYVQQIKDYNAIVKKNGDKPFDLETLKDLLADSCILYSIANDVSQKSLSKYLKSIKRDLKV